MHRLFLCTIFLFITTSASAQKRLVTNQQVFTVEDGLPQSFISSIIQDKDGFIWVSTMDGLARYDGRSFKRIAKRPTDTISFRSQVIIRMAYNANNHFTVIYEGQGVDDFDPVTFKIKPIDDIPGLKESIKQGFINPSFAYTYGFSNLIFLNGIGTGINWINTSTGLVNHASVANGKLKCDTIIGMVKEPDGTLHILTPQGIEVLKKGSGNFEQTAFRLPFDPKKFYLKDILLLPDKSFVIPDSNRLVLVNPNSKTTSLINIPEGNGILKRSVNFLNIDHNNLIYFENNGRIFRRQKNGQFKLLWQNTIRPDLRVTSCLIDRNDVLWVSVDAQGLMKVNLLAPPFESYIYTDCFFVDALALSGIPKSQMPRHWINDPQPYLFRFAYGLDSTLFLSHNAKGNIKPDIFYWNNNQLVQLPYPPGKPSGFRGMEIGKDGEIWVADLYNQGLWCWKNRNSNPEFFLFDTASKDYSRHDVDISDLELSGDQICMTTNGSGFFRFKDGKMEIDFRKKSISRGIPNNLTDICTNPTNKNQLWIGSMGEGLILWDRDSGVKKIFTTTDGLPNNTIYCIVADASGMLWLSTNKGICRFDPISYISTSYVKTDGLAGNEFNRYHKFVFPDGRIAFGGLNGFSVFHPNDFTGKTNNQSITLQVTGIQINNKEQDFTQPESVIKQPFSQLRSLTLPYNKNYLSVEFASLQFNEPLKIRYRYMLKGADETWREGVNNVANYTQLRPGKYTLLMNATTLNGSWSDSVLELSIVVNSPFWATWWAYCIYALLFAALIRYYFIYQQKRLKEQQQRAYEQKEAERLKELDEVKDRFFSNITHEFRTPLTLILTPLETLNRDRSLSEKARITVHTIQRNTKQLLSLINEFLDFAKLNKGQLNLSLSEGELSVYIDDCLQQFQPLAHEKNIALSFSAGNVTGLYRFDGEKWQKILVNLISNAIKFTPRGGKVSVLLSKLNGDVVQLKVADTGTGIPADQLQKIFDRFYQVDTSATRNYSGTGIGLSFVKELVELMKGKIQVESALGEGSLFTVTIPVEQLNMREPHVSEGNIEAVPLISSVNHDTKEKPVLLVAEDNDDLRLFLSDSLSEQWKIIAARDGTAAWQAILAEMPNVVVSDVMMPGFDGFELCRLCKNDQRTAHIGFILLTSKTAHATKVQGLESGADDYVTKPFHLDELQLRISNLLELQQKQLKWLRSKLFPEKPSQELPHVNDVFIKQLYQLLDEKLADPQMNVEYLASNMAMSRSSFNRKLKALLGISANDLVRRYRLQKATALLATGMDITSVAYEVGFTTPSYFTKCFKEEYNITPSEHVLSINTSM